MAEQNHPDEKNRNQSSPAPPAGPAKQSAGPRRVQREIDKLDATTDEEIAALKVNLKQDRPNPGSRDSSGRIVDELAEEKIGKFTEVGPSSGDRGAESVTPGRDKTSATLRQPHPNTGIACAQGVVEGNLDEPGNEQIRKRKVDEGTAA